MPSSSEADLAQTSQISPEEIYLKKITTFCYQLALPRGDVQLSLKSASASHHHYHPHHHHLLDEADKDLLGPAYNTSLDTDDLINSVIRNLTKKGILRMTEPSNIHHYFHRHGGPAVTRTGDDTVHPSIAAGKLILNIMIIYTPFLAYTPFYIFLF